LQSLIASILAHMASITIRKLDEQTKARLRVRAAHPKRSMEEEARNICVAFWPSKQLLRAIFLMRSALAFNRWGAWSCGYPHASQCATRPNPGKWSFSTPTSYPS